MISSSLHTRLDVRLSVWKPTVHICMLHVFVNINDLTRSRSYENAAGLE